MRIGMSDAFQPESMDDFSAGVAERVRDLGFDGIFTRFTRHDPFRVNREQCARVRAHVESAGLTMHQASGYRPPLIHPDESRRREAVAVLCRAIEIASWLGAEAVDTGPGSMSPSGPWCPDPYNFTETAAAQLIKSLREAARAAECHGVPVCIEGHQLVTLRSAPVTAAVLEAVDSPWIKAGLDVANWVTLETIYDSGPAISEMLAVLEGRIGGAHVKDVTLSDTMMVHIDHCAAGQGLLDIGALLHGLRDQGGDTPVIVEAASSEELPEVLRHLRDVGPCGPTNDNQRREEHAGR